MTCDEKLKKFLISKSHAYRRSFSYYTHLFEDTSGVKLGKPLQSYVDVFDNTTHPLYVVVACLPRMRLWRWIGLKLKDEEPNINYGCYSPWAKEYFYPLIDYRVQYESRVDEAYNNGKLDAKDALAIYTKSMEAECRFFDSIKADRKL